MSKLIAQFQKFHSANPQVFSYYVKFADQALQAGRKNFSISLITERVRWYVNIETTGDDFKINNNHRAYYARMLDEIPRFKGLFRMRLTK